VPTLHGLVRGDDLPVGGHVGSGGGGGYSGVGVAGPRGSTAAPTSVQRAATSDRGASEEGGAQGRQVGGCVWKGSL
jgi:hypothetical protein